MSIGLALLLCAAAADSVAAQRPGPPATGRGDQGLVFGTLSPGQNSRVAVTDASRRAEWTVEARGRVSLVLHLPAGLTTSTGAIIPLSFGPVDAALRQPDSAQLQYFDPAVPLDYTFTGGGTVHVLLGGEARPSADQIAGSYSAEIILMIVTTAT